jgi:hypothetical protein
VRQFGRRRFSAKRLTAHTLPTEYWKRKDQKWPKVKRECERGGQFTIKRRKIRAKGILLKPQFIIVFTQSSFTKNILAYIYYQSCVLSADEFIIVYREVKINKGVSNSVRNHLFTSIISIETQIYRGITTFLWITAGTFPYKTPWSPFLISLVNTPPFTAKKVVYNLRLCIVLQAQVCVDAWQRKCTLETLEILNG